MHCSDDFHGTEIPLVLVVAMATKALSMDSAAGPSSPVERENTLRPYDKYPIDLIKRVVDFFVK